MPCLCAWCFLFSNPRSFVLHFGVASRKGAFIMLGGYANRVAWIDLASGNVEYKGIAEEDAKKYFGARGLGVKYVFDNGPEVEPLSPDNILCVMNGPLTGTNVNMSGRLAVVTKSPLTGTVADSPHGRLDRGQAASGPASTAWSSRARPTSPVYAYCENDEVTLHDASDVWGKDIHETLAILQANATATTVDGHGHRPGRREPGALCRLGQCRRSSGRPQRHRRRRRQQEPQGHRHQGRQEATAPAGRQGSRQGSPPARPWPPSWPRRTSRRPRRAA